jgi:hypothetical protein
MQIKVHFFVQILYLERRHSTEEDTAEGLATTSKGVETMERDGFEGNVIRGRLRLFEIV